MVDIEKFSGQLIDKACSLKATDIHIVPRKKDAAIHFRIGFDIIQMLTVSKMVCERLISHFKFIAQMDIGEKRRPQNGALTLQTIAGDVNIRLSTLPTVFDESLVIRIFLEQPAETPEELSLFPSAAKKLLSFLQHTHGLIIFTGPTGSGKTTTLYSLLDYLKKHFRRSVITLEDPVERKNENMLQVQVNEKAGITYPLGLKAILRHDPDVIMVGEIRDEETAHIAIRAGLTGHLVLTTMHTRDANGAIYRLLEFGVSISEIEQTLIAIAAQRLVELVCPFCGTDCSPYCKKLRKRNRLGVYELLYGKPLNAAIQKAKGAECEVDYVKLKDVIKKGIALGYLHPQSYKQWVYEYEA